jgi:Mg-chelatase subunit ChlD
MNNDTKQYGDKLPAMYFGAHNGVFRMYPARHSSSCRSYDNRKRPWYVAASSGPKDIIIILDISGSMKNGNRLDIAKDAIIDVINAFTIGDHFGLVLFSATAVSPETYLLKATKANKNKMKDYVMDIKIDDEKAGTNFYAGFKRAFELLTLSG